GFCHGTTTPVNATLSLHDARPIFDDWTYESAPGLHSEDMKRTTNAGTVNWTWLKSATTVIDTQVSANAFFEGGERNNLAAIKPRSEEHTSELQSRGHLVCRLLLEQ